MAKDDRYHDDIPTMSGREFAFIREKCGITQAYLAKRMGYYSRSAIWSWEQKESIEPYKVKALMNLVEPDVFLSARRMYKEMTRRGQ